MDDLLTKAIKYYNNGKKLYDANDKTKAMKLLSETDWSQLPDVNLQNKQEFVEYRAILRDIVLNPQREVVFPTKPIEVW